MAKVSVLNMEGNAIGPLAIKAAIFGIEVHSHLVPQEV